MIFYTDMTVGQKEATTYLSQKDLDRMDLMLWGFHLILISDTSQHKRQKCSTAKGFRTEPDTQNKGGYQSNALG